MAFAIRCSFVSRHEYTPISLHCVYFMCKAMDSHVKAATRSEEQITARMRSDTRYHHPITQQMVGPKARDLSEQFWDEGS